MGRERKTNIVDKSRVERQKKTENQTEKTRNKRNSELRRQTKAKKILLL
jgi:hypothetical protein